MGLTSEQRYDDILEVGDLLARLAAKRWWIAWSSVLFGVLFAVAAFIISPVYRASVVMVSASTERSNLARSLNSALGSLGGLSSLAGISVGVSDAMTEESLAVLGSRQFTENFIYENQLLPRLFARKWDMANGRWRFGASNEPTLAEAAKYFDKSIRSVVQNRKTGLVTLQIDWKEREAVAAWANELVRMLNVEMRARAIAKADASVRFLEREVANTSEIGKRDAIYRLIEAQVRQRMLAEVTDEFAFRVVDKAMAPDANDPIEPRKLFFLLTGLLIGALIGSIVSLMFTNPRETLASAL